MDVHHTQCICVGSYVYVRLCFDRHFEVFAAISVQQAGRAMRAPVVAKVGMLLAIRVIFCGAELA